MIPLQKKPVNMSHPLSTNDFETGSMVLRRGRDDGLTLVMRP
jgi:hypothetical protein